MPYTYDQEHNRFQYFEQTPFSTTEMKLVGESQKVAIIVAVDIDGGYSKDGKIPWHYSDDFKWFKSITGDSPCVMGRTTYEDICDRLGDKAAESVLPGRVCYVVTSRPLDKNNATAVPSFDAILNNLHSSDHQTIYILGGLQLFAEALPHADTVYLTVINKQFQCDKFFPMEKLHKTFKCSRVYKTNEPDLRFTIWERKHHDIIKQR